MESITQQNKKSSDRLCRCADGKTWQAACAECTERFERYMADAEARAGKTCYTTAFCDVGLVSKPAKILPFAQKIRKTIQKKFNRNQSLKEAFPVLQLTPEMRTNALGQEEPAVQINGDKFTLYYTNDSSSSAKGFRMPIRIPVVWYREDAAYVQQLPALPNLGLVCHIQKSVYPQPSSC